MSAQQLNGSQCRLPFYTVTCPVSIAVKDQSHLTAVSRIIQGSIGRALDVPNEPL